MILLGLTIRFILLVIFCGSSTQGQRTKNILLYTPINNSFKWRNYSDNHLQEFNCPATNCKITQNHTYLPSLTDYDVIAFNSWNIQSMDSFPPTDTRRSDQIYTLFFWESPARERSSTLLPYSHLFNWTMGYRMDADVLSPYGQFYDKETHGMVSPSFRPSWKDPNLPSKTTTHPDVMAIIKAKTKMTAWFVSNCKAPSQRKYIVEKMQQYSPVDIYGKCGTHTCDRVNREDAGLCRRMVETDYRFYLSFENSLCRDYITEKVFEMMDYYVIPVVYGGADYTRFLPPRSYINILDFNSVAELVDYMNFLAAYPEEYIKYFWWKDHYNIRHNNLCHLCEKITLVGDKPNFTKYYTDVDSWFKNGTCIELNTLPLVQEVIREFNVPDWQST